MHTHSKTVANTLVLDSLLFNFIACFSFRCHVLDFSFMGVYFLEKLPPPLKAFFPVWSFISWIGKNEWFLLEMMKCWGKESKMMKKLSFSCLFFILPPNYQNYSTPLLGNLKIIHPCLAFIYTYSNENDSTITLKTTLPICIERDCQRNFKGGLQCKNYILDLWGTGPFEHKQCGVEQLVFLYVNWKYSLKARSADLCCRKD